MTIYLPLPGSRIMIDGNSIATDIYTVGENWGIQLQHQLAIAGIPIGGFQNFAVGGQTTQQMANDAATTVDGAFDSGKFNILFVLEGRNDIATGATPEAAAFNTFSYCAQRRSRGFYVILLDTFPSNEGAMEAPMAAYNQRIEACWKNCADVYLSCRREIPQIVVGPLLPDGLHPSATGHAYIAAAALSALKRIPLRKRL
jgi:lysophospholipase L1-like esterase